MENQSSYVVGYDRSLRLVRRVVVAAPTRGIEMGVGFCAATKTAIVREVVPSTALVEKSAEDPQPSIAVGVSMSVAGYLVRRNVSGASVPDAGPSLANRIKNRNKGKALVVTEDEPALVEA